MQCAQICPLIFQELESHFCRGHKVMISATALTVNFPAFAAGGPFSVYAACPAGVHPYLDGRSGPVSQQHSGRKCLSSSIEYLRMCGSVSAKRKRNERDKFFSKRYGRLRESVCEFFKVSEARCNRLPPRRLQLCASDLLRVEALARGASSSQRSMPRKCNRTFVSCCIAVCMTWLLITMPLAGASPSPLGSAIRPPHRLAAQSARAYLVQPPFLHRVPCLGSPPRHPPDGWIVPTR